MIIMPMCVSVMRVIMPATLPAPSEPKRQCGSYQYLNKRFHWMTLDIHLGILAPGFSMIMITMFVSIVIMTVVILMAILAFFDFALGNITDKWIF